MSVNAYDVDYASVPLTNDSDDEDRFNKYIQERGQVTFRKTTYSPRSRCCGPKLRTTALVCVGTFVVIGIVIASMSYNESTESNLSEQQQTKFGWSKTFNVKGGEAPVRLLDIDGDGIQDILVAMSVDPAVITKEDMDFCSKSGSGPTCNGEMYALRGYDGKLLWTKKTRSDILFMNCIDFDINMDHHADCVVPGRNGLLETVDVKTAELQWH